MFDKMFLTLQMLRGDFAARFDTEEGATAVEYGLLVALIAVAIILAVTNVGNALVALFNDVASNLS